MKYISLIMALLLLVSLSCFAQAGTSAKGKGSAAEQQIQALLDERRQAAVKADASALEATTADDYVRIGPDGGVMNKSEYLDAIKSGRIKYQSIEVKDSKIQVYGNTAVTTSAADVKGTSQGQDMSGRYRVSQVFVKRNGKWQAVHFHGSLIK